MSAEEAVTDALQTPVDPNAQSAEDAKKMLEELQNDAAPSNAAKPINNATENDKAKESASTEAKVGAEGDEDKSEEKSNGQRDSDRRRDDRRHGRSEHGGRDRGRGRGRGRGDRNGHSHRNYRDNFKSVLTREEESSDPVAIRKQVEFYFSDTNLPKDAHLFNETGGSENKPVSLEKIHSFNRMRHFQPFSAIVDALRESKFLDLADDDTAVRRKVAWEPTNDDSPAQRRSIYAKGFGDELPSTQFDIEAFFADFGATNEVRLRRSNDKLFKGSVFVEFENEDLAKAFLTQENPPKYKGAELQIMSKKEYCDKKNEDLKSGKIKPNNQSGNRHGRDRHHESKRKRDDEDDRDWRTRRDEDRKRGFRDDKRHGGDRRRGGGYGGGRSSGPATDDKGIPSVKSTSAKQDGGREDAIAKAKAAVEAENKKDAAVKSESAAEPAENPESKKRARDDDGEAEAERESKKVDVKTEAVAVS